MSLGQSAAILKPVFYALLNVVDAAKIIDRKATSFGS
jgi:hypothetical protein